MNEQGRTPDKSCGFTRGAKGDSRRGPLIKGNPPRAKEAGQRVPGHSPAEPEGLSLEILAANPGDQDPEGADEGHDQGRKVEHLVDEDADRRATWHQSAK